MKAYKVFNPDWTCRGFQYEVGQTYEIDDKPVLCEVGFHACLKAADCFNYYSFDHDNNVAEVELLGDISGLDGDKQATNKIKIVRELSWNEVLDVVNTGKNNTGLCNTGHSNTGNRNTGDSNTGNWNTGHSNTGDSNTGNWNTGNRNTGHSNTGNWNTGNRNTGNWNTGHSNTGFFNTDEPTVRMFNKDTGLMRSDINFPSILHFNITEFVDGDSATDEEKKEYKKELETCGGFLRELNYKEAFKKSWENGSEADKKAVMNLPNFDADVFYEISGIDLRGIDKKKKKK